VLLVQSRAVFAKLILAVAPFSNRITERFGREGTFRGHLAQPSCSEQRFLQLDQSAVFVEQSLVNWRNFHTRVRVPGNWILTLLAAEFFDHMKWQPGLSPYLLTLVSGTYRHTSRPTGSTRDCSY